MRLAFPIRLTILFLCFAGTTLVAQDKNVRIHGFEVDGQPVKASFKVFILTNDQKSYKAKTNKSGFIVPAEVFAKSVGNNVGVIITFKKFVLEFYSFRTANFDVEWTAVGVDTEPFAPEHLGKLDPVAIESIYYIRYAGNPPWQNIVVVAKRRLRKITR